MDELNYLAVKVDLESCYCHGANGSKTNQNVEEENKSESKVRI